jgi:hypothetical protein
LKVPAWTLSPSHGLLIAKASRKVQDHEGQREEASRQSQAMKMRPGLPVLIAHVRAPLHFQLR